MRDQLFGIISRTVLDARSVEIVGDSGSGRSVLLNAVADYFLNRTWNVVRIAGVPEFRSVPFGALRDSAAAGVRDSRGGAVARAVDDLAAEIGGDACILVDDWEYVDDLSRGVIRAAAASTGTPVVLTRSVWHEQADDEIGIEFAHRAQLTPLRFDEVEVAVRSRLGAPIEQSTMSRIYAKSGGNIGFAMALVEAAVREERIVLIRNRWTAVRHLWSPALVGPIESRLRRLDQVCMDALATLALLGVVDDVTATTLIEPATLEWLEDHGFVSLYPSAGRFYVSITPPLVADYLRESTSRARIRRLGERVDARLQAPQAVVEDDLGRPEGGALYVRLVHEKHRIRRAVAYDAFVRGADPMAGVTWVATLVETDASADEIDEAIARVGEDPLTDDARVGLAVLRAENLVYGHGDLDGGLRLLDDTSCDTAEQSALVDNGRAGIALMCGECPMPEDIPSPEDDALSIPTRVVSAWLRAGALTARARFAESEDVLEYARDALGSSDSHLAMISALNAVAAGDLERAMRIGQRGFDEAKAELDVQALRRCAYVLVMAWIERGRYAGADGVLDLVLMLGEPGSRPRHEYFGLMSMGAVMAHRRLFRSAAADFQRNLDAIDLPPGPFPAMGKAWALARGVTIGPDAELASREFRRAAEESEGRGNAWVGRWARLVSIELSRSPDWLAELKAAPEFDPGRALTAYAVFAEALVGVDSQALLTAAHGLADSGRYGLALATFAEVEHRAEEVGDDSTADQARAQTALLAERTPLGEYDTTRFLEGLAGLSDRETEIAALAAAGMSNQQIADEFVLSVRTVEGHLNRALHKLGITKRSLLSRYFPQS